MQPTRAVSRRTVLGAVAGIGLGQVGAVGGRADSTDPGATDGRTTDSESCERWSIDLADGTPGGGVGPALASGDDAVYAGTTHALLALSAADGTERWRFELEAPEPIDDGSDEPVVLGSGESPVGVRTVGELVVLEAEEVYNRFDGGVVQMPPYPRRSRLLGIDVASGEVRFEYPGSLQHRFSIGGTIDWAVGDDRVFLAGPGEGSDDAPAAIAGEPTLRAVDGTGTERWRVALEEDGRGGVMRGGIGRRVDADANRVTVVTGDRVAAFDPASGERRWSVAFDEQFVSSPIVDGERVYAPLAGQVVAKNGGPADAETATAWRYGADLQGRVAVLALGAVLVVHADGTLYGLDPATGERQWRVDLPRSGRPATHRVDDTLYVGGPPVSAIDLVTGEERWRFDATCRGDVDAEDWYLAGTLTTVGGSVLSATTDVRVLDPETGLPVGRLSLGGATHRVTATDDRLAVRAGRRLAAYDAASLPGCASRGDGRSLLADLGCQLWDRWR